MQKIENQLLAKAYGTFSVEVREKLFVLRQLIFDVALNSEPPIAIEETLKWAEPAYLCQQGSTIRLGSKHAGEYAIYFNCNTQLLENFREVFGDDFNYEGNRAIVFTLDEDLNQAGLKQCISVALTYHKRKHLNLLGM